VGQSTERVSAWYDASSWMKAPAWCSPRAESVMFFHVRRVTDPPMMRVGWLGPK
jgi:hypothetical protein